MASKRTRSLIVWGTSSGAGKSWLATALCRLAARRGIDVAPYKAQNMSNNARVVPRSDDGAPGEIGSAQYFQALAARAAPHTGMNPVLLKPESDTASQVVLNGYAEPALALLGWRERSGVLAQTARSAFRELASQHELIVVEGAGSPAEINLAEQDYVNLGTARWARELGPVAALLVSDIDRGGAFAHVHGTWSLLPADLRGLLAGYVLNRFRGDAALLAPGPHMVQQSTGLPLAGVIPLRRGHGLPEEDGWFEPRDAAAAAAAAAVHVAVLAPPQISNLDEFQPLARVPGLRLTWARTAAQLQAADWIVLPGSKQTSGDLAWLRSQRLDAAIVRHAAAGKPVLGVCGGLQMLGRTLDDPQGFDGQAVSELPGLGLLPLSTRFAAHKHLSRGRVVFGDAAGPWAALRGVVSDAYQIRCGQTQADADSTALRDAAGDAIGWQAGPVLGVYAHGLFESPSVLQALFGAAVPTLDDSFELLADLAEEHLDARLLSALLGR